ncbi:MAG: type II secretion system F family protein [Candidatus Diapherotrites archaeon]|nr:type II secretion system F family protein [Candidatus Diapherotrites archaeon]
MKKEQVKKELRINISEIRKRFSKLKKRWKILLTLIGIAILLVLFGAMVSPANLPLFIIGAFFEITIPFAFQMYVEHGRIMSIEEHFPDFLRDIAEYKRSGVTLSGAIQNASHNDYGQLSPEVKKMATELSWGLSFDESMHRFGARMESQMVDRAISIITIAQTAGGEVTTILETVSSDLRKLKELEKERVSKLSIYTMTIYTIYLLLLFIIVVLTESLAPAVPKMQAAGEILGGAVGTITEYEFRTLLFHVALVESFFSGLIAGQMGEGRLTAGIKHAVILVLITLLAFQLVPLPPASEKLSETILELPPTPGFTSQGLQGLSLFEKGFTAEEVADQVRKLAKERNREQYKAFTADNVEFIATICNLCAQGKLSISTKEIIVNEPVMMRYTVRFAEDRYVVEISDGEAQVIEE